MMRVSKKMAKMDTEYLPNIGKGEIRDTLEKIRKATKKLGPVYGASYGRGRVRYAN